MADRYWVGGTGTWTTTTTNWSATSGGAGGATVPTAADNVFFDQAGTYTVTMTGARTCLDITVSAGTVTFATGTTPTLAVSGSMSLVAGTVWSSTGAITFNSATTGRTITTNGTTLNGAVTFNNATGGWSLGSALTVSATLTTTLTAGALTLNGFNLTTGAFATAGAVARSIDFGSNNIILNIASGTALSMAVLGGFSRLGAGGFTADASVVRTYTVGTTSGGATTNVPSLTFTGSGTAIPVLTTGGRFNNLDFGTTAFTLAATSLFLNGLKLSSGGTFTNLSVTTFGAGTITPNGKSIAALTINHNDIPTGITTLAGALSCTTYTQTAGVFDFATFNLTCSGVVTYTGDTSSLSNVGTITCTTWTISSGTLTFISGTITPSVSFVVLGTGTFNYSGGTLSPVVTFTHTDGVVNLNSNLSLAATGTYTLTAGILNLNNYVLTTGIFISNSITTRSILFGSGNIVLAHPTAAQTVLSIFTATNFNYTGTGGFITDASVTRTFAFGTTGGTFYNAPNLSITSGSAVPTFTTQSWFNVLNFTGSTSTPAAATVNVDTLILDSGGTYTNLIPQFTRTQTWSMQYSKQLGGIGVNRLFGTLTLDGTQTYTTTSVCSVVTGTLDLGGYDLTIGSFSSSGTNIRSVVFGAKNIILNNSVAAQIVLAVADATNFSYSSISGGFVSDASVTKTYQFGSTTGGSMFNAPNLLINSGVSIPTITTGSWFNKLDFTGSVCTPAVSTINVNSLTLASGGTFTNISVIMRALGDIIPNGKSIAALTINHVEVGTTRLLGALTCTTQTYIAGNIDFGNFNLTGTAATYNSGVFSNINVLSCTTFTVAGNFALVTGTITPSTSVVLSSGSFTYSGGTLSPVAAFTHTAGTVILGKEYALTATGTYTLTAGSLNLNGYNLITGIFSSTGTGTRSINFGSGNIALAHTTAAITVLNMETATNFTWTGTGGFTSAMSTTRTFTFSSTAGAGGSVTNAPNLALTSGASIPTLASGSWFKNLNFTGTTCTPAAGSIKVDTLTLASGGTYTNLIPIFTRTQTWTAQFGKQLGGIGCNIIDGTLTLDNTQTYTAAAECLLEAGTLDLGGSDLTIFSFFSIALTTTRSINFGSNNIIFASACNISNATNFTWTGTGGFVSPATVSTSYRFGTVGGASTTNAPNLTFTGSGTGAPLLVTGSWVNKLDFGTAASTIAVTSLFLNSLTLSTGGTFTNLTATMVGTGTINGNGKTISALTITYSGTTTLSSALAVGATTTLTIGTLDLNGFTLTTGIFSSTSTNTRAINFGSGNIALTGTGTVLNMATATNFTDAGTGGFVSDASLARTYVFGTIGGTATNAPNLSIISGASIPTITSNSWFNKLDFTGSTCTPAVSTFNVGTLTLATGGTYTNLIPQFTRTQTWTAQFSKQLGGIGVGAGGVTLTLDGTQTYIATSEFILTAGTLNLGGYDLTIGRFASSITNTRSIAFGSNNIILATTTAALVNLSMADATNFTWTGTGGFTAAADIARTFTFGTTGGTSTNAPRLTFTGSGTAIPTLTTGSWFDTLNFGSTAFTLAATTLNLDNLVLSSGGTFTNLTATMVGAGTITPNGKTVAALVINNTGTTTLAGALATNITATTTLTAGILDLAGFTLTTGIFSSNNTNTRGISFGSGSIVLSHTTAAQTVLAIADATNFTWTGTGGFTSAMSVTRTFTFGNIAGGTSTNAPNLLLTTGASAPTLTSGSWFNILDFTGTTSTSATTTVNVNSLILATGGTYTGLTVNMVGNGTITSTGKTIAALSISSANPSTVVEYKTYAWYSSGSITFPSSNSPPTVECLIIGGGGGGGASSSNNGGGGGGAGGLRILAAQTINSGETYDIVVGLGGLGARNSGATDSQAGQASSAFGYISSGGGRGGSDTGLAAGGSGGSGGGGSGAAGSTPGAGNTPVTNPSQGNNGGAGGTGTNGNQGAGGGGGAGAVGQTRSGFVSGAGGQGAATTISLTGLPTYYAGGGGGGTSSSSAVGALGGLGGGGDGSSIGTLVAVSGTNGLGGGGGGASQNFSTNTNVGGNGGSGIVIIRYPSSYADPLTITGDINTSVVSSIPVVPGPLSSIDIVTLNSALTVTGTTTLTLGNLNLNNFTLTTSGLSSSNTNVRAIAFGSGSIALTGTTALAMADATNFSYTGTGGLTSAMSAVRTFTFGTTAGGSTSNALNLALTSGASIPTLTSGSWFKVLNFTGSTCIPAATTVYVDTLTLATGGTYTGLTPIFTRTQTWTSQFSKVLDGIGFNLLGGTLTLDNTQTYSATGSCNLMAGTLDLGGTNLTVGRFISNNTNTRAIAFGSNNIVLATTVVDILNLDLLDATGFTWTGTGGFTAAADRTRTYVFGTTSGTSTNSPNLTFTGTGAVAQTIVTGSWFNDLNFGTTTFTIPATTINVNTLTLSSTGTYTDLIPLFTRTQTWTSQYNKMLGGIGVNNAGVTLTLGSAQTLNIFSTVIVNAGTLSLNNNSLQCYNFSSTSTGSRSIVGGGEINVNNNWTVIDGVGFVMTGSTINMIGSTGKTFAGGGGSYGTLVQKTSPTLSITGSNSFESLQVSTDMINIDVESGEAVYTTPGTYSWTAPAGVTNVNVVAIGAGGAGRGGNGGSAGGGGGGGGLGWKNYIPVVPGQSYTVVVGAGPAGNTGVQGASGGNSYFINTSTIAGFGGTSGTGGAGGSFVGDGGGNGGNGSGSGAGGGGGAGGYSGNGGDGGVGLGNPTRGGPGSSGTGGGGGGGGAADNTSSSNQSGGGGGGVGIYGGGTSGGGGGGAQQNGGGGGGGSSGANGANGVNRIAGTGGAFGGGGGGGDRGALNTGDVTAGSGNGGAVRIVWGYNRTYPDVSPATIDFMIVGGGGGSKVSGGDSNSGIGGAGAGGVVIETQYAVPSIKDTGNPQTLIVTVGSGGTTANGSNTTLTSSDGSVSFTALGGGLSGTYASNGVSGGSGGGGGGRDYPPGDGGAGLQPSSTSGGYGNAGGKCRTGNNGSGSAAGGGGGGAGSAGSDGIVRFGGAGGIGIVSTMLTRIIAQDLNIGDVDNSTGSVYFAGGGGGMANGTGGPGGLGGGGIGATSVFQGVGTNRANTQTNTNGVRNGKDNTGGGAGGAAAFTSSYGGTGGSGIAIIRQLQTPKPVATVTGGCTIVYDGVYILYVFKSSGTITFI